MPNGTVKFFNTAKKFGFVSPDEGGKDVFVPIASVTAAGVSALVAGQRVSFETAPDARGPKVVSLKLIDTPVPAPVATKAAPVAKAVDSTQQLTFYYDPAGESARDLLAALRKTGFDPRVVDYVAAPPNVDELRKLSMNLHVGSLVRRSDPLFRERRLDDRFLGQTEFWEGIVENPTLINGPILATANRTCICRSDGVVKDFLESIFPGRPVLKEKVFSEDAKTPAPEPEPVKAVAKNVTTIAPELTAMEPLATKADRSPGKPSRVPKKKKAAAVKPATKAARKAVRKPVPKSARARAK